MQENNTLCTSSSRNGKTMRIVIMKGPTLRNILVNSRKKAKMNEFHCIGPPFCSKDKHLSCYLSELNDNTRVLGNTSLAYIPNQKNIDNQTNIIIGLSQWIIRIGVNEH